MQTYVTTTPFGRRPLSLGFVASQVKAKAMPEGAAVNKWAAFQHVREARELLGATDRSLAILNALLSFHRGAELSAEGELIVWPSNEQLSARANGISPATLRRHLAVLVECGLIIRRDSPNGKRFARKDRHGEIEQAYGFDLSPIVARAEEFQNAAEAVQAEKKAYRLVKERLTLLRRDIVKMIDAGIEEKVPGNWGRALQSYQSIIARLPRTASRQILEDIADELQGLNAEIREILESQAKPQNMNANESHSDRHKQNSNPELPSDSESGSGIKKEASGNVEQPHNLRSLPGRDLPLGIVLDACPNLRALTPDGAIRHWRDFLAAAETARTMLGVSPSAWQEAQVALGEQQAAITLAAIYQRAEQINSAGGYLRNLTDKAKEGKFSTWPMIMALLRAKLDAGNASPASHEQSRENAGSLQVSEALLKSLKRPRNW